MRHVSTYEVAEINACETKMLAWRLAWAREYRTRVEQELMARLDASDVSALDFDEISVKQGRPVTTYTFTKSDRAILSTMSDEERDAFWEDQKDAATRPWLSISIKEKETD
jgi:hypothetical protein